MMTFLICGILLAVLVALFWATFSRASSPERRPAQVLLPPIALILSVVLLALFTYADSAAKDVWVAASNSFGPLQGVNAIFPRAIAINALFAFTFLCVKLVYLMVVSLLPDKGMMLLSHLFAFAYEMDDENRWVLKRRFLGTKKLFRKMFIAVLILSTLLFVLTAIFPRLFGTLFFPAFAIITFGEVVSFLSGLEPKDKNGDAVEFVDDGSKRYSIYQNLMRVYESYQDRVLYSDVLNHGYFSQINRDDIIGPLEADKDRLKRLAAGYLRSLKSLHHDIDADMAMGMVGLLEGKNTLFATPFYRDYTDYFALPLVRTLMQGNKVVVMFGEDVSETDLQDWFRESLTVICGVESMWRLGSLRTKQIDQLDVAFMSMSDANNLDLTRALARRQNRIAMVAMFNPSVSFATSQIGFGILARRLAAFGRVVYCAFDRNTNGLVDALSHALSTPFCEVCPTISSRGETCSMIWKAEDPQGVSLHHQLYGNVAQYLGLGTELGSIALRYDVDKVTWLSSKNVPINDVRWIALQYYRQICEFANLPTAAWSIDGRFSFHDSLWSQRREDRAFLIVEDESCNSFEILRQFSTRACSNSFINVISPDYLLRDYMSDNSKLLVRDSKAIPRIVPDYSLGLRNVALSVFARLAQEPMDLHDIRKQFELAEIESQDIRATLCQLALKYIVPDSTREIVSECLLEETVHESIDPESLRYLDRTQIRLVKGCELHRYCETILRNAFYVCEDESIDKRVLGSCLYGHVYQNMVPGQFVSLEGRYYEVLDITVSSRSTSRVALRRAADHFSRRRFYRQVKEVRLGNWDSSSRWHRTRSYSGVNIQVAEVDVSVHTDGYAEMASRSDFRTARYVGLSHIPDREYFKKSALKISVDGASTQVIATLTVLLGELIATMYADNAQYLLIGSTAAERCDCPRGSYVRISSEETALDPSCIYVFEDSNIDLGLIDSFDRNVVHFLELLQDFLVWHSDRMARKNVIDVNVLAAALRDFIADDTLDLSATAPEDPKKAAKEGAQAPKGKDGKEKKPGLWRRLINFLKGLFGKKPQAEEPVETEAEDPEERRNILSQIVELLSGIMELKRIEERERRHEDHEEELVEIPDPYKESNFLFFGGKESPDWLAVEDTAMLLADHQLVDFELSAARNDKVDMNEAIDQVIEEGIVHLCDFCGKPLLGVEYDILEDGRERCLTCSRQTVKSQAELEELFASVRGSMCVKYGIHIKSPITVRMVSSAEIASRMDRTFTPTPGFDARAVGVAVNSNGKYTIYLENGAPRLSLIETISHELTHIWQYENWNDAVINARYGSGNNLVIYEGMAVWSAIQYLFAVNEPEFATRLFTEEARREDEYGKGLRLYYKKYGMQTDGRIGRRRTPFQAGMSPL